MQQLKNHAENVSASARAIEICLEGEDPDHDQVTALVKAHVDHLGRLLTAYSGRAVLIAVHTIDTEEQMREAEATAAAAAAMEAAQGMLRGRH